MDENKGMLIAFCAACVVAITMVIGFTVYIVHDLDVNQKKMTACVQASGIWVQNSNREMECRKG